MIPAHLMPLIRHLSAEKPATTVGPWKRLPVIATGGLTEIGFAPNSDLILVLSQQGCGVIDGLTGNKVARDAEWKDDVSDTVKLFTKGIGPLSGQQIPIAGLRGGGLPLGTEDGWTVEMLWPEWPDGWDLDRPVNRDEARRWYLRSAENGYGVASNNLGTLYLQDGDDENAQRWFKKAAQQGFSHSPRIE